MEAEASRPHLRRLFESIAGIMDIDHGLQRLELQFEDGILRCLWVHAKTGSTELGRYDDRTAWLVARDSEP